MKVEPFCRGDIPDFLWLAAEEQWVAEPWEFEFLLTGFPEGCFCVRDQEGRGIAFVTSLQHDRSGWIGNLIVAEQFRGQGIGEALFRASLDALKAVEVETFWLTASKQGKSLYEKHGFACIDTIVRWSGYGKKRHEADAAEKDIGSTAASVSSIDYRAWGDRRDALLEATVGRGRLLLQETGFMVIQSCGDARQFGPFSALDIGTAEHIFETALDLVPYGTKIYLDAPVSNRAALRLFNRRRMRIAGTNELMYAGKKPYYRPEMLYGLATMGSCG
jgi:ribosomal protein S18 acetylase RimI-like enzyme